MFLIREFFSFFSPKEGPSFEQTVKSAAKPSKRLFPINGRPTKIGNKPSGKAILVHRRTRETSEWTIHSSIWPRACTCQERAATTGAPLAHRPCAPMNMYHPVCWGWHAHVALQGEGLLRESGDCYFFSIFVQRRYMKFARPERLSLISHVTILLFTKMTRQWCSLN